MISTYQVIATNTRRCVCCGSENTEKLDSYEKLSKQRSHFWKFQMNHAICKDCGFCFLSPCHVQEDLNRYYQDSFVYYKPDFIAQKRYSFIENNRIEGQRFLEVGANSRSEFHTGLLDYFSEVVTQDINEFSDVDFLGGSERDNKFDCLAHYFVLEHITDIDTFLRSCFDLLKDDGHMIIEVPDFEKYKLYFRPLTFHEHTNHFRIESLERICYRHGFELLDQSKTVCSRNFGFSALFRKVKTRTKGLKIENLYRPNLLIYNEAIDNWKSYNDFIGLIRRKIEEVEIGKKVVLWGANEIMRSILDDMNVIDNLICVDSDHLKKDYLEDLSIKIYSPLDSSVQFGPTDILVLCASPNYKDDILSFLLKEKNVEFSDSQIWVASDQNLGKK